MLRIEIKSPNLEKEVDALIGVGLYPDSHSLIIDALKELVISKKQSRLDASIQLYQAGKVTLGRASELAGIHRFEFELVLIERGIFKVVEVDSVEELEEGVALISSYHKEHGNVED